MKKFAKGAAVCLLGASMLFTQQGVTASASGVDKNVASSILGVKDTEEAAESNLYVQKIDNLSDDFIRGVDISSVLSE